MNFENISQKALLNANDIYVNKILEKQKKNSSSNELSFEEQNLRDDINLMKILQEYGSIVATEAIKLYHESLKEKLKQHNINI